MKSTSKVLVTSQPDIRLIKLSDLQVRDYQRPLDTGRVQRIVQSYNATYRRMPIVAPASGGTFSVIDGQHTLAAERDLGAEEVWCEVKNIRGDNAQEAEAFVKLNTSQKRITPLETFQANVIAGVQPQKGLQDILDAHGLTFGTAASANVIACVSGMMRMAQYFDAQTAGAGIIVAVHAFGREAESYKNSIPVGLAYLIGKNPHISLTALITALSDVPRGRFVDAADKLKTTSTNSNEYVLIAQVAAKHYNKNRRGKNRVEV